MSSDPILDHPHVEEPLLRFSDNFLRGPKFPPANEEMEMLDGLPTQHFGQSLTYGMNSSLNKHSGNLIHNSPLLASQSQMEWPKELPLHFELPYSGCYFNPPQVNAGGNGQGFIHRGPDTMLSSYEPVLPQSLGSRIPLYSGGGANLHSNLLPDARYWNAVAGGGPFAYEMCADTRAPGDFRIRNTLTMDGQLESASPYAFENTPPVTDLSSSKSSEDGELDDAMSAYGERGLDEPYAKLIYRALLGAPNHSMVLQNIYRWFLQNTDKGKSTSAGWRNSIRHNLSMNKAFRKTERTLVGDDRKKTSEWVLEPFAIENGVTPTTRYRKAGKKTVKSDNPTPSRVRSGRAGGLSAGKTKFQRQKSRRDRREAPVETPIDYGTTLWHLENPMLATMNCDSQTPSTPIKQELTTPMTANIGYTSPPFLNYQFPILNYPKASLDAPWSFQDVKEVHMDDGPLFYRDEYEHFGDNHSQLWSCAHY